MFYELAAGRRLSVRGAARLAVRCLGGRLRVTQEGFPGDYYLASGMTYLSRGNGLILVDSCASPSRVGVGPMRVHDMDELLREARALRARSLAQLLAWLLR